MPSSLFQFLIVSLVFRLGLSVVSAAPLCPAISSQIKSEGTWPIPEKAFTEQAAKRELEKLNRLLGAEGLTVESVAWETSFVIVEGWYLKRQALEAKKRGEDEPFVSDFCDFMKDRAYVQH